jgi:hypothetical protein
VLEVARWLAECLKNKDKRAALEKRRCFRGPYGEEIHGSFIERLDELRKSDLRPSVIETFERCAKRHAKLAERNLAKQHEPLHSPPRWWRPMRSATLLLTGKQLIDEGREMKHCVASYAPYVKRGNALVVSLNVLGHRSTANIDRSTLEVKQHRGVENRTPPELCKRALTTLLKRAKRAC